MTTTFLSKSQQVSLQQALNNSKLSNNSIVTSDNVTSPEQNAYSDIAVTLYRFNLQKIKWSSFLKTAINTANDKCQWLACELLRCQKDYKAQPNDSVISEQSAFINGIFSEEVAYIDVLLGTKPEQDSI